MLDSAFSISEPLLKGRNEGMDLSRVHRRTAENCAIRSALPVI